MIKQWRIREDSLADDSQARLIRELGVSPLIAKLLVQRGIHTFDEAKRFFRPSLSELHDPFLMQDMRQAVERIRRAVDRDESVLVYGDYDVDGITSVAVMSQFLQELGLRVNYYIPDRYKEGYGISELGVRYAAENNYRLVIALDCGIKAIERMQLAEQLGVDFIICDHHLPGDTLPKAVAVLDPKRSDCHYPYKQLSGCGVGFKLIQAYCAHYALSPEMPFKYLDLVAVSIISDIVEIGDENRIITHYGLRALNERPCEGLKALLHTSKLICPFPKRPGEMPRKIRAIDVIFKLGPRINAAGRMDSANLAVELLVSRTGQQAREMAELVGDHNKQRQEIDGSVTLEALRMLGENPQFPHSNTTVIYHPSWHKGVLGIVASRLLETHYRPTIVLTESNGVVSGSARSVSGFDIHSAIEECEELLLSFGGHRYAAGLSLLPENVQPFSEKFERVVSARINEEQKYPSVEVDAIVDLEQLDDRFIRILDQFDPFGPGNKQPIFMAERILPSSRVRVVGHCHNHLQFDVKQQRDGTSFPAIGFSMAEYEPLVRQKMYKICFTLEKNYFNGQEITQLNVIDIKPQE